MDHVHVDWNSKMNVKNIHTIERICNNLCAVFIELPGLATVSQPDTLVTSSLDSTSKRSKKAVSIL